MKVKTLTWSKTDTIIHTKKPFNVGRYFLSKPRDLRPRLFLLLGGAGVSAVGTTLLQNPGWNEGKARNETLGKHGHKK